VYFVGKKKEEEKIGTEWGRKLLEGAMRCRKDFLTGGKQRWDVGLKLLVKA